MTTHDFYEGTIPSTPCFYCNSQDISETRDYIFSCECIYNKNSTGFGFQLSLWSNTLILGEKQGNLACPGATQFCISIHRLSGSFQYHIRHTGTTPDPLKKI